MFLCLAVIVQFCLRHACCPRYNSFNNARLRQRLMNKTFYLLNILTELMKFSVGLHVEPKLVTWRVMFLFVWESKVGLTIRQFTKIHKWFFICWGLTFTLLLFFLRNSRRDFDTIVVVKSTCRTPLVVAMELTKETCWNPLSEGATAISHHGNIFPI